MKQSLPDSQIEIKTDENDLVTLADKKTEMKISKQLQSDFKNVKIIGEEGMYFNKENENKIDNNYYWTIDPIDGTKNYINNNKNFCSMISLAFNKSPIAAFIFSPLEQTLTYAFKNHGSFCYNLKNQIKNKLIIKNKDNIYGTGGSKGIPDKHRERILKRLKSQTKRIFIGSAGIETLYLVSNQINFIFHGRVTPWDHSPVHLITKEAGGIVLMLRDATEYNLLSSGPILACRSTYHWKKIRDTILPLDDEYRIN